MAGITASYNVVPRIRNLISDKIIVNPGGGNPVDLGQVQLPNVRGQLTFVVTDLTTNFFWSVEIQGGYGSFPGDSTQNFYGNPISAVNCSIIALQNNRLQVTTPAADSGGRVYVLQFFPVQSVGPTINQTSVNSIVGDLSVKIIKQLLVQ